MMMIQQIRTYVLQDVTEEELDDLYIALMISVTDYREKMKKGDIGEGGEKRRKRMEVLANVLHDVLNQGENF